MSKSEGSLKKLARFENRHSWLVVAMLTFCFSVILLPMITMIRTGEFFIPDDLIFRSILVLISGSIGIALLIAKRRYAHEFESHDAKESE